MATVHPSRMALIPQAMRSTNADKSRNRSPSPRRSRRSASPVRNRSRDQDRDRRRDDKAKDSRHEPERRGRERSKDNDRDVAGVRRASPQYEDYKRPAVPPPPVEGESSAPWRAQDSMYPGRRPHQGYSSNGAGADFMESRRLQREARTINVWPPSPKQAARELSPKRKKSGKSSKRHRDSDTDSSSDSEEERRRKERKERKRARRARDKGERGESDRKHRHRHRSSSRRRDDSDDEEHNRHRSHRHRSKRSRTRSASKSASVTRSRSPNRMDVDRKDVATTSAQHREVSTGPPPSSKADADSDDEEIGPAPVEAPKGTKKVDERSYGGALLRGEGSAMAAFLQDGTDIRIPRRGEIGLNSDQIASYEDVGYVMSGSRHRRMNAVRMRKENQVISAEEKRGILKLQREERERREAILREEFSELVNEKLKASTSGGAAPPASDK